LTVGTVTEDFSEEVAAGLVIEQSVLAGNEVAQGTSIWMTSKQKVLKKLKNLKFRQTIIIDRTKKGTYPLTITLPNDKDNVSVIVQRVTDIGIE